MEMRTLGQTGLQISRLGIGLAEIGYELTQASEAQAAAVLNTALDGGINFLDTAACYGISEELIGRTIADRRDEYVLATKAGHAVEEGEEDWTASTITRSIERSLKRMKTDHVDLVQLHSCGVDVLERGEVIEALLDAKEAGKTRFVGYSGDNEAAEWAVESGHFDTLQTSFNLVDQKALGGLFSKVEDQNMGLIIKRPIANATWGAAESRSSYHNEYHRRAQRMAEFGPIPEAPEDRILLALGFVMAHEAVDTAIVGTKNPDHVRKNIHWVEHALPISDKAVETLHRRFQELGQNWKQMG